MALLLPDLLRIPEGIRKLVLECQVFLPGVYRQKCLGPGFGLEAELSDLPAIVLYRC